MRNIFLSLMVLANLISTPVMAQQSDGQAVSLVELYTSQGCSSCPPADVFLGDLIKRDDVLALSFHVDYWNYIGWNDPFSDPVYSQRQKRYAQQLGLRYVYTPQMVVQGRYETTGSKRGRITDFINQSKALPRVAIKLNIQNNTDLIVSVAGANADQPNFSDQHHEVWVAVYDNYHATDIGRGENTGRKLENFNVVRNLRKVGDWYGDAISYKIDLQALSVDGSDACAVFIQSVKSGQILGASRIEL